MTRILVLSRAGAGAMSAALFSILLASTGHAQLNEPAGPTPAISFSEVDGNSYNVPNLTRGYTIDLTQPIAITALGIFDSGEGGLLTGHVVTVWNAQGSTLASTVIPAGTGAELINQFRYAQITPLYLSPGYYTIGAYYPNTSGTVDYEYYGVPDLTVNSAFTIEDFTFAHPGYWDPSPYLSDTQNFGANFVMEAVPEPSTLALFGLGASALIYRRRSWHW